MYSNNNNYYGKYVYYAPVYNVQAYYKYINTLYYKYIGMHD